MDQQLSACSSCRDSGPRIHMEAHHCLQLQLQGTQHLLLASSGAHTHVYAHTYAHTKKYLEVEVNFITSIHLLECQFNSIQFIRVIHNHCLYFQDQFPAPKPVLYQLNSPFPFASSRGPVSLLCALVDFWFKAIEPSTKTIFCCYNKTHKVEYCIKLRGLTQLAV